MSQAIWSISFLEYIFTLRRMLNLWLTVSQILMVEIEPFNTDA